MTISSAGHPPVGATTHFPQRSVFSAPILEHASRSEQPSIAHSEQQQQTQSNACSQSVHPTHSVQPSQSVHPSQSAHPSQSGQQQTSAVAAVGDPTQQEATSHQATSRIQPAASGFQSVQSEQPSISIQPSTQTPFNVVTSGESGPSKRQTNGNNVADKQCMAPPAVDQGFATQISPFVAQSEHSLHIQQAPHTALVSDCSPPQKHPSSRSGRFTYGSAYPQPSFGGMQHDQANVYNPNMQSHMSSQGSAGWQPMPQFSYPPPRQQQQQSMSVQSWPGYDEVRTSPRHPGAWHWSDGIGQTHTDGLHQSTSATWDSQHGQSSQYSAPTHTEWQQEQPWHTTQQQQSDASGVALVCDVKCKSSMWLCWVSVTY